MMFPLVRDLAAEGVPVRLTCGVLGFTAQAFYKWRSRPVSDRDWADAHTTNAIVDVHTDDPEFGYRFIADELDRAGQATNERRVWRLCRENRVWSTTTRRGRRGAGKSPGPAVHDDLVQRNFTAAGLDEVWLTDITEHPTVEGKLSICSIKDVCSNRIVGYALDERMTAQLAVSALRSAIARRHGRHGRGPQRQGLAVPVPRVPSCAHRRGTDRFDGSRCRGRRQRGDGIVPLAPAEERAQPSPLENPRRAELRGHHLDRAHLQPSTSSTRARQAHTRRVRTRSHQPRRPSSMINPQPPSTELAADPNARDARDHWPCRS